MLYIDMEVKHDDTSVRYYDFHQPNWTVQSGHQQDCVVESDWPLCAEEGVDVSGIPFNFCRILCGMWTK